jgi:cyclophilin family peptidyl-prolyl cis-trans isomerase/HEAT repeat protein
MIRNRTLSLLLLSALTASSCVPDASPRDRVTEAYLRIVDLEDRRPTSGPDLQLLVQATASEHALLRAAAVRALGRLEDPGLAGPIADALDDPARGVRLEAAYAMAQAHFTTSGDGAYATLGDRFEAEPDPAVRGELARSLGRLRLSAEQARRAERLLLEATHRDGDDAPLAELTGVLLGLEALLRAAPQAHDPEGIRDRMDQLAGYSGAFYRSPESVRVRTLALTILGHAGLMRAEDVQRAVRDDAPVVAAAGMRFFDQIAELAKPETLRRAIASPSLYGVIEAFGILDRGPRTMQSCGYLLAGARVPPENTPRPVPEPIRVRGVQALREPCPDPDLPRTILREVEATLDEDPVLWQAPSYALLSLASVYPGDAAARLADHAEHANPFVRANAARAATLLGNRNVLRTLAGDASPNVRTTAVEGLFALDGHRIDDLLFDQLSVDDPQLVMTASRLLSGTPRPAAAADALMDAFERMSAAQRETWRDPRMAMAERLEEVGDARLTERMLPYLSDFDGRVAEAVASALRSWNGRPYTPTPLPLPREPLPTVAEMHAMEGASVLLHMQGGGEVEIRLHPWLATTNTYRFWRLVREGYFDGLTFHRWAPNFVLQGGSPHANEYQGDGPYSRDEVGRLPHWRGTVGISTRGHDTGDGQIFVNLLDNVRLDHAYTIVGTVVGGMDVVDGALEGAVIERAEVVPGG